MGIQVQGAGGTLAGVGAEAQEALHVVAKPQDYGVLGHYRISVVTGTLAAAQAAANQYFQFKWTDATRLALIMALETKFQTLTAFTAATLTDHTSLDAFIARSFAAGGGGTTLTLTG